MTVAFDPNRHVSVSSGSFHVDVNELCAAHTLVTYEENLSVGPARLALGAALAEADLARVDEEGCYYMTGRKKNLIILDSGENVSPEELEKLLGMCDAIKECIVKEMGKKIGTVVCCEDDKQQQVKAFVTELNRTLPMYKRISVVECSAEPLPRNALGKLLRK